MATLPARAATDNDLPPDRRDEAAARVPEGRRLVVLLPLAFFSDVFVGDVPAWMERVGDLFPLKHLQNSLAEAWAPTGAALGWDHVGMLLLWTIGASLFALRRFRWDAGSDPPASPRSHRRARRITMADGDESHDGLSDGSVESARAEPPG
ncbi:ABC transporter permease [Cellulomonas humilata]|uniref:ABC transporter permease n=1 Tax=Cellulomonas humilata TaxID=144055 RepID=A0ABU0EH67_9CELL|nr:ABC transporter permease [Cellulomonas humilata]MDQ0374608.1 hypothetical protein [Cellulomonas humilata]